MPDDSALVRSFDAVIHREPAVATDPAPAQLGVEVLEHLRCDLADRHVAERGLDVKPGVLHVALQRVLLDLVHPHPHVEGRSERRARPGMLRLVDLGQQTAQDALSGRLVGGGLHQPQLAPGHRVDAGAHPHLVRLPPLTDAPRGPTFPAPFVMAGVYRGQHRGIDQLTAHPRY